MQGKLFWQLGALSDEALLEGLSRVVVSGRRMLAELLAHLCEVESRRLHLDSGYPSMFAYCTARFGFSEDEAYRRIEVARVARRAPIAFQLIAEGRLTLSAAALLKPYVLAPNLVELVHAVSDKSVQAARLALAAFFPRPDVVDSIRKLPDRAPQFVMPTSSLSKERETTSVRTPGASPDEAAASNGNELHAAGTPAFLELTACVEKGAPPPPAAPSIAPTAAVAPAVSAAPIAAAPRSRAFEPLSPGRYKVSFTASDALKEKLELARDLMRHSAPGGDLATIAERALDLLIADLMKRRFGAGARVKRSPGSEPPGQTRPQARSAPSGSSPPRSGSANIEHSERTTQPAPPPTDHRSTPSEYVPRTVQRAILERDGLRCTWRGPGGTRCSARAWLERDHKQARSLGGATTLENLRHLCRAHNRRAAEHIHGEHHIDRAIRKKRPTHPLQHDRQPP